MRESFSPPGAAPAIGPYSPALRVGQLVFLSGSIPLDPATGQMTSGGIAEQAERVMQNVGALLRAAGADYAKVVRTTVFLTDMDDFAAMNEVYGPRAPKPAPNRTA